MRVFFYLMLLLLLTACTGCDGDGKLKPGEFEDPAFAKCVQDMIDYAVSIGLWQKDDPDIYNKVNKLECYGGGVKEIGGVENMPNINWLAVVDNQVESLEPLRTLTKLKFLKLDNNKIRDVEPLSGLTELTSLLLYNNYIKDISSLCPLKKLDMADFSENCIADANQFRELEKCAPNYTSGGAENYQDPAKCQ